VSVVRSGSRATTRLLISPFRTYRNSQSTSLYNTEAPSTLILPDSNGSHTINLAFATGNYQAKDYNTRLMYIDASRNPLIAADWTLVTQPLLQSSASNKAYAPGSGGFFTGPDGTPWISYGGYDRAQGQGGSSGSYPRTIRAQKVAASSRGVLLPIIPISTPDSNE
jgi:GH43 family beta-xylosidase